MFNQCFISVSKVFQKCFENDSKVFVSLSVLKLFVCIEVIAATQALGGLVNNQDIMVIKDRSTGYIAAVLCKDQSTPESVKALMTWFHNYGLCHILRSDDGGSV